MTLTLAGIGAFVLSIGMAVDANILIFERMKEELRAGRAYAIAVDAGFRRAWPSIRDSNVATLITTAILFVLGGGIELPLIGAFDAPLVQGFAVHAGGRRGGLDVLRDHRHARAAAPDRGHPAGAPPRLADRRRTAARGGERRGPAVNAS